MSASGRTPVFLGVDVGTTGTKTLLLDVTGAVIASSYRGYEVTSLDDSRFVQDPRDWRDAVIATIREVCHGGESNHVVALSISAQGGTMVPVSGTGDALVPARSWLDRRAQQEAVELTNALGEAGVLERTGWPVCPNNTAVQIKAFAREHPAEFASTRQFLDTASYLTGWLTGTASMDLNVAGISQLVNVARRSWDTDMLAFIGIDSNRLPELTESGDDLGTLTDTAAADLGLSPDTRVIAGGQDQYCAALGAGVHGGGVLLSCGTAWVCLGIRDAPDVDPGPQFAFGHGLTPNQYGYFGEVINGGASLEWIRRILGEGDGGYALRDLDELAGTSPPGAGGAMFFPYFDGTHPGLGGSASTGSLLGLGLAHDRAAIVRAVMEGITVAAVELADMYRSAAPGCATPIVVGGATKSEVWRQMIADIGGQRILFADNADAACVGAGALAAFGAGEFDTLGAAARSMSVPHSEVLPNIAAQERYRSVRARYRTAASGLLDTYGRDQACHE